MPDDEKWERCRPDHPNRCQATGQHGQCTYISKPGYKYCPRHAASIESTNAMKAAQMYQLAQYQQKMESFAGHGEIKSLRAEIGILRMTLQTIITQCNGDDKQLLAFSGKISDIIMKIQATIRSCQKLETQMGLMLDRDRVLLIGQKIVEIIAQAIPDGDILDTISGQIVKAIIDVSDPNFEESIKNQLV